SWTMEVCRPAFLLFRCANGVETGITDWMFLGGILPSSKNAIIPAAKDRSPDQKVPHDPWNSVSRLPAFAPNTTAAETIRFRTGFADGQRSAFNVCAVEGGNRFDGFSVVTHVNEPKPFGL